MALAGSLPAIPLGLAGNFKSPHSYNAQQPDSYARRVQGREMILSLKLGRQFDSGRLLRLHSKRLPEGLEQHETLLRRDARIAERTRMCGMRGVYLRQPILSPSEGDHEAVHVAEGETPTLSEKQRWTVVRKKVAAITSNAQKQAQGLQQIRSSLGVDVGDSRTGMAISLKGYAPRPLSVLHLRGDKLIKELLQIASIQRADEFIVGLPRSFNDEENLQSSKTRCFAGRLASQAALRGWRVFLMDEYGSSQDGLSYMLETGVKKQSRKEKIDAYAAMVLLQKYFNSEGAQAMLLVPNGLSCQETLCQGDNSNIDDEDNYDDTSIHLS